MATNKFLALLNKDLEIEVKFVSHDVMSAKDFDDYAVKTTLNAGNRCFATKTKALAWVALMNKEYGDETASFVGKY
jgi:hypothetical protein